jgi:hemerythrin
VALIQWDSSFSVKVAEIDRQHQKLVFIVNELNDAMKHGQGKDVLGDIVNGLITYTATHFHAEEKYFHRFGYPEIDSHKKEHAAFVTKVSEFKDGFEKGTLGLSVEVMTFLSDWLKKHIKVTDMKYSQFFNEKGLK